MSETLNKTEKKKVVDNALNHTIMSWSKQKGLDPFAIQRAEGVYLYEFDGRKIIDFSSGLMNSNIGYGDQRVTEAVVKQMQEVSFISPACVSKVRGDLGKKLAEICPGDLNRAFFTVCGATSNENAIKLARLYTGRHKIFARYQSYHGATIGTISAGGDPRKIPVDSQQAPNFVHFDLPYSYRYEQGEENLLKESIASLERQIHYEGPNTIAAILLEGESGTSGCLKYPENYLKEVRKICDKYGILLIMDEVMSGFGRTGQWFGFQNHGIVPDMISMAKGLTCGYLPLGCVMVTEKIASKYDDTVLPLGLTYSAHAVSCAAALEVLKIYEEDNLIERAREMGKYMEEKVEELKKIHPSIGDFRNTGLLGCIEIVKSRNTKEPMAPFNAKPEEMVVMNKVAAKIKELGMYTFVKWNFVFVAPPLIVTKEQIDEGLAIISEAIKIADQAVI
ncbi:aminotransferase class III-fold pyridoxal phosphate-dependent enzyme [Halpernia sp.]|uniref:aminotransferase class III-fold pyridoxal phosphate-dependent enzyme n=1 Tax=Halpernia sp. TaxID=2782209 RepID=UPI003A947BB8